MPSYIEQSLSTGEQVEGLFKFHWFAWVPMVIWIMLEEFGKLSKHSDVRFLSSLASSAKLQVLLHSQCDGGDSIWVIVFGHGRLL